ncbi:hypothetical protein GGD38_006406 [Chitinophagaceae bacterium OAS944]|nr:hypothetical protein [Chitinophagaceae bacterium OAS944]
MVNNCCQLENFDIITCIHNKRRNMLAVPGSLQFKKTSVYNDYSMLVTEK